MKSIKMTGKHTLALCFMIRLVLGVTFIYASWHKIADPAGFAKILYGYDIFPGFMINILAITIPFIELVSGFSLIFGFFSRSALLIINGLLLGFIVLIGFNLLRGHQFDCGCFEFSGQGKTAASVFLLIRDGLLLLSGLYVFRQLKNL